MPARRSRSLMQKLREIGVEPASRHGQNFLIDLNLVRLIIDSADLGPRDVVLEVGTGTGSLTTLMAPSGRATSSRSRSTRTSTSWPASNCWSTTTSRSSACDALRNKNRFSDEVMAAVGDALAAHARRAVQARRQLALQRGDADPVEPAALRAHAPHDGGDDPEGARRADRRGAVEQRLRRRSAFGCRAQAATEIVRIMPPKVFWPAPKVESAIVKIVVDKRAPRRDP